MHAVGDVVVDSETLHSRVADLAGEIARDYQGKDPLFVGVLKGAYMFLSDLVRAIDIPTEVDFIAVSSYGAATASSGVVRLLKDLDHEIEGRHVIVVEDIIDSGLTLKYLLELLEARDPASVEACCLLARERHQRGLVKYLGFEIPEGWVVGYGLDVGGWHRDYDEIRWYNADV
ncbi:MAG: hypoxanthine phosphoribosyltransferase [Actinomycetia bacterium]|nr:hypoxanthine phosphoribosyltransferase [Actinomycetes bacterium]MCP4961874.1 hypoxanthine phosphoribosyltransferase [Actinomycetes bacterium]